MMDIADISQQAEQATEAFLRRRGMAPVTEAVHRFLPGSELLDGYLSRLRSGDVPQLFQLGEVLDGMEIAGELITIIGAPPGQGKTCLSMQIIFEAIERNPKLRAYVANAEMGFEAIARRELTRLTRINSDKIRFGKLAEADLEYVDTAASKLRSALTRISFDSEADHEGLLHLLDEPPGLVVVDYLQKFAPSDRDIRVGVNRVMNTLRRLAKAGHGVLALSATKRDVKGGHDSKSLGLASFRESGECEYQADSAYVLRDDGPAPRQSNVRMITLGHVKNRHGARIDRELLFNMPLMRFESRPEVVHTRPVSEDHSGNENPFNDESTDD